MNVVYNCDERFASVFAVSMLSLFENNKDEENITVYLIEDRVGSESKEKLLKIAHSYGRSLVFLPMPDIEKIVGVSIVIPGYNRMATCGRLFVTSLLPEDVDRIIYADSDTMFTDSISELWNYDLSGYAIGMANGAMNPDNRALLGLSSNGTYYNSGMILADLKRWRNDHIEEAFISFLQKQGGYVPYPDEGTLNAVFDGQVKLLPLRYNALSAIYAFSYDELMRIKGPQQFYSFEEVEEAKAHPAMVHFTNNFYMPIRPWVQGCVHPYAQQYLTYRAMTPWKDAPLWADNRTLLSKAFTAYCHKAPKPIAVWTASTINNRLKPMMHRVKLNKYKKAWGGVL